MGNSMDSVNTFCHPKILNSSNFLHLIFGVKKLRIPKFCQNWSTGSTLFGRQKFLSLNDHIHMKKITFLTSSTKNAVVTAILELQQFLNAF